MQRPKEFQPTRPLRGATVFSCLSSSFSQISTHAPLAGRDGTAAPPEDEQKQISTHAPLAGRDHRKARYLQFPCYFNPRAPCGARHTSVSLTRRRSYFNPRAPCGARPCRSLRSCPACPISTHAPLAGHDDGNVDELRDLRDFNPRAPCGARPCSMGKMTHESISTHAPLAGHDTAAAQAGHIGRISTHAPLAGHDNAVFDGIRLYVQFQPTRPLRGTTSNSSCSIKPV